MECESPAGGGVYGVPLVAKAADVFADGGAGLSIVKTSGWMFAMQFGALAGYLVFGFMADRYGRRPAFLFYVVGAAIVTPIYGSLPRLAGGSAETYLLVMAPLVGFLGTGYFSLFGAERSTLSTRSRGPLLMGLSWHRFSGVYSTGFQTCTHRCNRHEWLKMGIHI